MYSKLVKNGNAVKIEINGEIFDPLSFKSFRPTGRNVSDFYKAGIRLFCVLSTGKESATKGVPYSLFGESWIGEYEYDFKPIDDQLDFFIKNAPDAYFMLMLQVDTRDWWLEQNPEYKDSFWEMSQVAADERWRKAAAAYLTAAVKHVEEKYPDKIYCYFILGGCTTEWFSERDYEACGDKKTAAYRKYLGDANAVAPTDEELVKDHRNSLLDPVKEDSVIKYRKFHNGLISDTILYFAKKVKEATGGDRLVGVYFGYVLELGGRRLYDSGSLDYEKVFTSDSVDIIASPSAYTWSRRREGTSAYMVTVDTLTFNDKLYFLEFDQRTFLKPIQFDISRNIPGEGDKLKTEQATIDVMRRDFMLSLTKGFGIWWFDMFEGWFYSDRLMNEISRYKQISGLPALKGSKNASEIAFIVDPESLYYANKCTNLNGELLTWERCELAMTGAPYDIYSLCDADKIDYSQYKIVIFPTLFKYDGKTEKIINEKIKKDGRTVMFLYAPFYTGDEGFSLERAKAVTEMQLKEMAMPEGMVRYKDDCYGFSFTKDLSFCVKVENDYYALEKQGDLEVLGRYQHSFAPALVRKKAKDHFVVFSGAGYVRSKELRDIAKAAGVHIYSYDPENIVFVNDALIGVYHRNKTDATICPKVSGSYVDLFTGKRYITENGKIELPWSEEESAKLLIKEN
ncbi:MAG: hypothetical protein IJS67_01915 [Clostridia bacterium]|nr:hypothetical protein [Clostridia bacterium]